MNKLIIVILFFFVITQFSYTNNDNYYINITSGVALYSEKNPTSSVITYLPYSQEVQIIIRDYFFDEKIGNSISNKIKVNKQEGWIFENPLKIKPDMNLYYRVNTTTGLFLREQPSPNAKIITKIPYLSIDKVLSISDVYHTINNKTAFWFKVLYKNHIGWIFTAYVEIKSHDDLINKENFNSWEHFKEFQLTKLNEYNNDYNVSKLKKNIYNFNDYQITIYSPMENKIEGTRWILEGIQLILFKNIKTNKSFYCYEFTNISKIKFNYPLKNTMIIEANTCTECDEYPFNIVFTFENASVKYFDFSKTFIESYCEDPCGLGGEHNNYRMNKIYKNKEILFSYYRDVSCNDNSIKKSLFCGNDLSYVNTKYFINEIFIIIKNENGKFISKYNIDSGIPSKYLKDWSKADILD